MLVKIKSVSLFLSCWPVGQLASYPVELSLSANKNLAAKIYEKVGNTLSVAWLVFRGFGFGLVLFCSRYLYGSIWSLSVLCSPFPHPLRPGNSGYCLLVEQIIVHLKRKRGSQRESVLLKKQML